MYRILARLFGFGCVHFSLSGDMAYSASIEQCERYQMIIGHFGVAWNRLLDPKRVWLTMLRDPVDRLVSQYYLWRSLTPVGPDLPHVYAAQTLTLQQFVRSREFLVVQGTQNVQTWFLADDFRRRFRKVPESDALDIAKQHIVERFAFVGLFEDYSDSVLRLCRLLNKPFPDFPIPVENSAPGRQRTSDIDPKIIASIAERNRLDQALFDFTKKHLVERAELSLSNYHSSLK